MAKKGGGGATGSVTIKKAGDRGGVVPGGGGKTKRLNPLAIDGGGSGPSQDIPKKTRVIGNGEV